MNAIKEFLTEYEQELGYTIPSAGKEAKGARRILDAGFDVDAAMACYRHFKGQHFWKGKHVSLMYIASNISAWNTEYGKKDFDDDSLAKWYEDNNRRQA